MPVGAARAVYDGKLAFLIVATGVGLLLLLGVWMPLSLSDGITSAAAIVAGRP